MPLPPRLSDAMVKAYARAYHVDMSDLDPRAGSYPSFDSFFTRSLRRGARVIADASVVCPADGHVVDAGQIDIASRISVKGQAYDVDELAGHCPGAARYAGGSFTVIYLAPGDYHRVHAPVDGRVTRVCGVPGDLFPVSWIGEKHIPRLYVRNHRVVVSIETQLGLVTVVMVGATMVGRITSTALGGRSVPPGEHAPDPPMEVRRGDEIGTFHLGSTVVVLVQSGVDLALDRGPVRYGQSLVAGTRHPRRRATGPR